MKAASAVAGLLMAVGAASPAMADAGAGALAAGSPGVLSGNVIQVPIHIPVNVCGNSINIIALLNPTFGNTCVNAH
ncbi:chaplin [Streptomyces sp. NBC_01497]